MSTQEAPFGHTYMNESNANEEPLPPPNQPSTLPPPYYVCNAQQPYLVAANTLSQLRNSLETHENFLKGKPKALGIVVIVTAILQIALGIALLYSVIYNSVLSGIPFWGPIIYIIAGSLSIAAQSKPNTCLVRGSVALNITTSVLSAIGTILSIVDIALLSSIPCVSSESHHYGYDDSSWCQSRQGKALGVTSILLFTNILLFFMSTTISVFGCRSLDHVSQIPQVFVIQNDNVLPVPGSPPRYSQIVSSSGFFQPPPPYFTELNTKQGEPAS